MSRMTPQQKAQAILDMPGWTQLRLGERLGVNQSTVNRWLQGAEPRGNYRDAISELYSELVLTLEHGAEPIMQVRLAGYIGAGQEVYQFDEDGAGFVEAPPDASATSEAVEVKGESMWPLFEDGTLLYYSRQVPPDEMLGKRGVFRLEDGRMLVKSLRKGSERGLYTLVSLNAPDIEDVALQWAAPIDWIKPR